MFYLLILSIFICVSFLINRRCSLDVAVDLCIGEQYESELKQKALSRKKESFISDTHQELSFLSFQERAKFIQISSLLIPIISTLSGSFFYLIFNNSFPIGLLGACLGFCATYLSLRRSIVIKRKQYIRDIEYYLPIVMERLVMGVQAGLDVFSSLRVISELNNAGYCIEDKNFLSKKTNCSTDPVTRLLREVCQLCENGIGMESALQMVSGKVESSPLKHAFIHLAVAQKEGGEMTKPLRELSEATHAYFRESIEEEIAKLPVKATIPLLITFAGLVIFFLTSPVIQIMKLTAKTALE